MNKVDKDIIAYDLAHLEFEAQELDKLRKKQKKCKHKMVDTKHCLKCGFMPEET